MVKFIIIPTSELLYLITNDATDAIKAVVHAVNTKFRKLQKNNVRNTNKTGQLKQVLELSSVGLRAASGSRTKKCCANKTSKLTGC